MAQPPIRIPVEIDNAKAVASAKQTGEAWVNQGKKADAAVKRTGNTVERTARTMAAGIGAATAAVAAHERQWLTAASSIVATFAAGGPIAGAIAGIAAAIGFLTSEARNVEFEKRIGSMNQETAAFNKEIRDLAAELRKLQGIDPFTFQLPPLRKELSEVEGVIAATKKQLDDLGDDPEFDLFGKKVKVSGAIVDVFRGGPSRVERKSRLSGDLEDLEKEEKALRGRISSLERLRGILEENAAEAEAKRVAALNLELSEQVALQETLNRSRTEFERFRTQVEAQAEELANKGASAPNVSAFREAAIQEFFVAQQRALEEQVSAEQDRLALLREQDPFERERLALAQETARVMRQLRVPEEAPDEVKRLAEELRKLNEEQAKARGDDITKNQAAATQFGQFKDQFGFQLTDTISQSIVAGIQEGGDAAQKVWEGFLQNLSGQLLNLGIGAALNFLGGGAGFGGESFQGFFAKGFADGGSFITANGPALFATSERAGAPELVQTDRHRTTITPVEDLGVGGGTVNMGNITINVTGGSNPRETARMVREEIARLQRSGRGRRTLGR